MAKYDWNNLEKEYILGDYKSVSAFLKDKGIPRNGSVQKAVKGWNNKKVQIKIEKSSKTIEKIIEKQSEVDANQVIKVNDVANKLLSKLMEATDELKKGTDLFGNTYESTIIDRMSLKKLTSALKDLNDILGDKQSDKIQRIQIINDLPSDEDED